MSRIPVIVIFDIGKTNKKVLLFDEYYKVVYEKNEQFSEITDEDGFACEDLLALSHWLTSTFDYLLAQEEFEIKAVNFSAYGASFVYLDKDLQVIPPLFNYLKPYDPVLQDTFYTNYGGEQLLSKQTASPKLGNLNSGMQLYRMKYEKPAIFEKMKCALHLPQYLSFLLSKKLSTDITSIGCHTGLWDFTQQRYHEWVSKEGIEQKFAPLLASTALAGYANQHIPVGIGLHDSSSALIPYLTAFQEPFILLSTGTWCISLNPFNHSPLTDEELQKDCLCYLSYNGNPVKASRLFAGFEHEQEVKKLAAHFNKPVDYFKTVHYDARLIENKAAANDTTNEAASVGAMIQQSNFQERDLNTFENYEQAYHQLVADIVVQQVYSTNLVLKGTKVKRIFVDGGFSKNPIFMYLLADYFPDVETYAASVALASSLGAALVFHDQWNKKPMPTDLIELKYYSGSQKQHV
jgi:sugar (pentulose or hexulose) kinase